MRRNSVTRPNPEPPDIISTSPPSNCADVDNYAAARRQPIRVLHIAQKIAGGIASFFEEIAPYQNDAFGKANVYFMIPSGSEPHLPSIDPSQIITFTSTTRGPAGLLKFGKEALDAIRRLRPDVVHLHSSFAGAVVRAFLKPGAGSPRVIYCPHGWAFGIETSPTRKRTYAAVERHLARRTDRILVNSAFEHELALQFGLPAEKLTIVTNGIGWAPAPDRRRRTARMQMAFIGRHDRQKGLDMLLDTIDRFSLPDIHFHIVGDSVVSQAGRPRLPPRSNLTFHGWLARGQISALLRDMDALVMPSRWEAFGLVAVEAMRAGVPVIASNRGALPEVVRDGVGGRIFDVDDADGLGRLLAHLDREELRRLGASARALWEKEYLADRMNQLTREAYEQVLASPATACLPPSDTANSHHPAASAAAA